MNGISKDRSEEVQSIRGFGPAYGINHSLQNAIVDNQLYDPGYGINSYLGTKADVESFQHVTM